MFTTVEEVKELTGYTVDRASISMAQSIIETYIGKVEAEIIDGNDEMLLGKATAYQAAYMSSNKDVVFDHMAVSQISQAGNMMTFRNDEASPFVAPLAILACKRLSWKRQRSVKTGSIFYRPPVENDWRRD